MSQTAVAGGAIQVSYRIANIGSRMANGIDVDITIGHESLPQAEHETRLENPIWSLDIGEETTDSKEIYVPLSIATGIYTVGIRLSMEHEKNTANNTASADVAIAGGTCTPDMYEEDDTIEAATPIAEREWQEHNACLEGTDWLRFEALADTLYVIDASWLDRDSGPMLEVFGQDGVTQVGGSIAMLDIALAKPDRDGPCYIVTKAWFGRLGAGSAYGISWQQARPDLWVILSGVPTVAVAGGVIAITAVVGNNGIYLDPVTVDVAVLLSPDDDVTYSDIHLGTDTVSGLETLGSTSIVARHAVPAGLSGSYHIAAIVDPDDQIEEQDESNNTSDVVAIKIVQPACAPDAREEDDQPEDTGLIRIGESVNGNHCDDVYDWLAFKALEDYDYVITMTRTNGTDLDPLLELYDTDGTTLLESASAVGDEAVLSWTATNTDIYFVNATDSDPASVGAGREYTVIVQ